MAKVGGDVEHVVFNLVCEHTSHGDVLVVCGSGEELGNWDPDCGLRLQTTEETFPMWFSAEPVPVSTETQYKYVMMCGGGLNIWEEVPNRRVSEEHAACFDMGMPFGVISLVESEWDVPENAIRTKRVQSEDNSTEPEVEPGDCDYTTPGSTPWSTPRGRGASPWTPRCQSQNWSQVVPKLPMGSMPIIEHPMAPQESAVARPPNGVGSKGGRRRILAMTLGYGALGGIGCGTSTGAGGLLAGGTVGAACGVLGAPFSFGMTIPVGAAIGGFAGLVSGTTVGGTVGVVNGASIGYKHASN
jgi:hypothetical protein